MTSVGIKGGEGERSGRKEFHIRKEFLKTKLNLSQRVRWKDMYERARIGKTWVELSLEMEKDTVKERAR